LVVFTRDQYLNKWRVGKFQSGNKFQANFELKSSVHSQSE